MSKKYFWIIFLFHLLIPISLFFPVLKMPSSLSSHNMLNIFHFIKVNPSTYVTVLLIVFTLFEIAGAINAVYGIARKEISRKNTQATFLLGFSSAILGAMFISVDSHIFFILCAISFIAISYASIKLMKLEK